jgi:hypothetical protein
MRHAATLLLQVCRNISPLMITIQRLPKLQCNDIERALIARDFRAPKLLETGISETTSQMQPAPESELDKLLKLIRESENILRGLGSQPLWKALM